MRRPAERRGRPLPDGGRIVRRRHQAGACAQERRGEGTPPHRPTSARRRSGGPPPQHNGRGAARHRARSRAEAFGSCGIRWGGRERGGGVWVALRRAAHAPTSRAKKAPTRPNRGPPHRRPTRMRNLGGYMRGFCRVDCWRGLMVWSCEVVGWVVGAD